MEELVNLTKLYIKAFSNKDLDFIHSIVDEGFILQDPVVSRITGKSEALLVIKKIFADYDVISFNVKNIFVLYLLFWWYKTFFNFLIIFFKKD